MKSAGFGSPARRRGGPVARPVASFVPTITEKAFEKHGFAAASLILDWAQIVGRELASCTRPERLKWPRRIAGSTSTEAEAHGRPGATLVLRVDAARALELEYRRAHIVERINGYFGYCAIAEVRLVQEADPSVFTTSEPPRSPGASMRGATSVPAPLPPDLVSIADDQLRDALARLARSVRSSAAATA